MGRKTVRNTGREPVVVQDGFAPTSILSAVNAKPSSYSRRDVAWIREVCEFGSGVRIYIPDKSHKTDFFRKGWICMYVYPFILGLRFPLPTLVSKFLHHYSLGLGQLMPQAWRILLSPSSLAEKQAITVSVDDVLTVYQPLTSGRG